MSLLCFEFQIASGTKPRCSFALLSKNYSKTFWTLSNFIVHKFSKLNTNTSISKNKIQRGKRKSKTNAECFHPFSPLFLTVDNYDSSSSYNTRLNDIKVNRDDLITFVKKITLFPNNCKYNI
jgi:hypothetical protein